MQYIKGMESYRSPYDTAITLGKFDGLHRGHQILIERVKQYMGRKTKSVVFSFDMVPFCREKGLKRRNLMTNEEKYLHLDGQIDCLIEYPFDEKIAKMEAEDFIKDILIGKFHAKYVVVGTDFHFGHNKRGDIHMLKEYSEVYGYHLDVIEKKQYHGRDISSTFIKEEVEKGNMELAEELLGYPYTIAGRVKHGQKLGRELGFPTMNVVPFEEKMLPPNGVYVSTVLIDGKEYKGIGNIGCKPTVSDENKVDVETFLFDYDGDAYGKRIEVRLHSFVRHEQKFTNVNELKKRVEKDIETGKKYFENKCLHK